MPENSTLFIPVILGTAREGRRSEVPARFLVSLLSGEQGVTTEFVDIRDHLRSATLPPWDKGGANEISTLWKDIATRADGFAFVVPEYNRGYPGEFKMFLDSLFDEYRHKPALTMSVSSGPWGGTRVAEQLRPVFVEMGFIPTRGALLVPNVAEAFGLDGEPKEREVLLKRFEKPLKEFLWMARALHLARDTLH